MSATMLVDRQCHSTNLKTIYQNDACDQVWRRKPLQILRTSTDVKWWKKFTWPFGIVMIKMSVIQAVKCVSLFRLIPCTMSRCDKSIKRITNVCELEIASISLSYCPLVNYNQWSWLFYFLLFTIVRWLYLGGSIHTSIKT